LAVSQPNIRYAHYHTVYVARLGDTNERIPEGVAFRTAYEAGEV
jgi:hypothetical protein